MTRTPAAAAIALCVAIAGAACGVKGPPLAPFVRVPAPIEKITATRLGNDIFVIVPIPGANIDGSLPADLKRVDVYGYTGVAAPPLNRWTALGTLVASIPVAPAPLPAEPGAPPPPVVPSSDPRPGEAATIRDQLTDAELVQGPVDPNPRPTVAVAPVTTEPQPLRRFYLAIGVNGRDVPGPPGSAAELTLDRPPDLPIGLTAVYTETTLTLTWESPGGLTGFIVDRALPPEPAPLDPFGQAPARSPDAGPTSFNVYRDVAPDPFATPQAATPAAPTVAPAPLNTTPLTGLNFSHPVELGRPRCYRVRAVRGTAIGDASAPLCITPLDVFPPAAPAGLQALASEGGISLLWDANNERDLRGYLVLRREVGDDTLQQLTAAPIVETRFRDTSVTPGRRYVYSVVAVDNRLPLPNVSAESTASEELAR